jgi:predicted anti-sigma-YlaC factor YlaD
MIEHLSAEQISQWMVGDRTPELERHIAECAECRVELDRLESALAQFRTAMRETANAAPPLGWGESASGRAWLSWPRLVLAAVALILLVVLPVSWMAHARQQAAEAALADSQLLESVDSAISQAVPEPMEPLVNLVSWNSSPAEQNPKVTRR